MALYINTNIWSLNAQRALSASQADLTRALERLSTTLRINRAADDPTGHAIVERYTSQINGVDQARRNVSHGTVFAQHADSNLESIDSQLQNIRTKIVNANVTSTSVATRQSLQDEIVVLLNEVERIAQTTEFDGRKILNNAATNSVFQVGPNAADTVSVATNDFRVSRFGVNRLFGNETGTSPTGARGVSTGGEQITVEGYLGLEKLVVAGNTSAASAKEIAKKVNSLQASTGVSASARTEIEITGWIAGTYTFSLEAANINQAQTFTFSPVAGIPATVLDFSGAISTFNSSSTSIDTGIVMSLNSDGLGVILTSAAGDNIILGPGNNIAPLSTLTLKPAGYTGTDAQNRINTLPSTASTGTRSYTGQVVFDSERPFTVISEALTSVGPPPVVSATAYPASGLVLKKPSNTALAKATEPSAIVAVSKIDVTAGPASIRDAFAIIDGALAAVATQRAALGSTQNRFNSIIDNLDNDFVNLERARGYIRDADIALESSIQTRASIQNEVNIAILGQANALQQAVLALLR